MTVKPFSKNVRYIVAGVSIALYAAGLVMLFINAWQGLALWLLSTVIGGAFVYEHKRREALIASQDKDKPE